MTDNPSVGVGNFFVRWGAAAALALSCVLWGWSPAPAAGFQTGPSCGQKQVTSPTGVGILVLFANNGSVQRYQVTAMADNAEAVHDARLALEGTYGPAGLNAPPLKIISYKPSDSSGGMQVPDKAIDSCGRTLDFN